eukprot:GHVU01130652.1.p5 GENE.GHVU01130652.1~~GHVU01130652.1.p5  ORF type:complete len:123 (+),score=13.25 GHVU01130652.1:899-1267(+)
MEAPTPPLPPLDAVNVNGGTSGRGEAALLTPSSPPPAALSGPHLCPSFPRLRLQRRGGAAAPSLAADLYTKASEARGQISGGNKSNLQVCARHPLSCHEESKSSPRRALGGEAEWWHVTMEK